MLVQELGFVQGESCPNTFSHEAKDITCAVHGDDFTSCGAKHELDWLESEIGKRYEITIGPRLGPGKSDANADCGLEQSRSVATPGVKASFQELEEDMELEVGLHSAFRGAAARGNYLSRTVWMPSLRARKCADGCRNRLCAVGKR